MLPLIFLTDKAGLIVQAMKPRSMREKYSKGENRVAMIRENLVAERIVVEHYRELVRFFGDRDQTTRVMVEGICAEEEDHASDMHDLLAGHEGSLPLEK